MENAPRNLAQWVQRLSDEDVPIMADTAGRISQIAEHKASSAAEMSEVILSDSAMTARVLRVANSVYYNPTSNAISTVSRAVVLLGFDVVRSIALSVAMVDTLLKGEQHERVLGEMARAFHAAVQAKYLAAKLRDPSPEEVFIATLLYRLGPMAFWCYSYGMSEVLEEEMALPPHNIEAAERRVLGFPLADLTLALNRSWHLSDLLEQSLRGDRNNPRVRLLQLADRLAHNVERGWQSEDMEALLDEWGRLLGTDREQSLQAISANVQQARSTAKECGAVAAARLIPLPPSLKPAELLKPRTQAELGPDPQMQLGILRELSTMLVEGVDLSAVLGTVLEGVFRGLAMDRAWFALLTPASGALVVKHVLGADRERLVNAFLVEPGGHTNNLFTRAMQAGQPRWVKGASNEQAGMPRLMAHHLSEEFFLMPVRMGETARGLFCCDRSESGRALDEESFAGFRHLCEQATLALTLAGQRRTNGNA